jgi:protein-tyrosine phosphatase
MNLKAAKTSAALCVLFLVVYGACNRLTALRHDVGTFHFAWERHIPFVPLMIVPYMSIDLFFIAAPFLCRDDRQRRTLAMQIVAAIFIAAACFLLFPLRFSFERPHVDGVLGLIFNNFRTLDLPYNQFPSLHIALRTILAIFYVRLTTGLLRGATRVWFTLIGLSTLLTYQHHVIDVIGGFALGVLCVHFLQDGLLRQPVVCNRRVGFYYAAGCAMLIVAAVLARPIGLLLLWPAVSLGIVAAAYFGLGPGIFRKTDGRLPLTTWLLLWPIILGQRLSLLYYARRSNAWDRLSDHVWIGRRLNNAEARDAVARGVTAVLDLTGELSAPAAFRAGPVAYRNLPIMDLTAPTPSQLDQATAFIRERSRDGVVYVHCKAGYSRSAAAAGAYLLLDIEERAANVSEAACILRAARPGMIIRPEVLECLERYHREAAHRRGQLG